LLQLHAPDDGAAFDVDADERRVAGVRDEGVPAVGGRRRVPRLLEPVEDMTDVAAVQDRQPSGDGVRDDGDAADSLDGAAAAATRKLRRSMPGVRARSGARS
jgi:hypothetical protein